MGICSVLSLNQCVPSKLVKPTPRHFTPCNCFGSPSKVTRMTTIGERRILRMSPMLTDSEKPVMFCAWEESAVK
jgi:hypothetical protein